MGDEDHDTDDARFEELGRRAGADLRRPAEDDRLERIARQAQRRRATTIAVGTATAAFVLITVAFAVAGESNDPIVAASTTASPVPTATAVPTTSHSPTTTTDVSNDTTSPTTTNPNAPVTLELVTPTPADGSVPATRTFALPATTSAAALGARFTLDGEALLIADFNGSREYVIGTDTGEILQEFPGAETIGQKLLSPDGSRYFDGRFIWDTTNGEQVTEMSGHRASFTPDGKAIAIYSFDGRLDLLDAITGATEWTADTGVSAADGPITPPVLRFSNDGSQIFFNDTIYDAATGSQIPGTAPAQTEPTVGFWDPTVIETLDGPYKVCDPTPDNGGMTRCDISIDGARVVMISPDGSLVQIWELKL